MNLRLRDTYFIGSTSNIPFTRTKNYPDHALDRDILYRVNTRSGSRSS